MIDYSKETMLSASAKKIRSLANRNAVENIIAIADDNAYSTLKENGGHPDSEWERFFVGSIGCLLSDSEYPVAVVKFFTTRGISY
jgi:hypothetical protein